jgi:hypothetical protein
MLTTKPKFNLIAEEVKLRDARRAGPKPGAVKPRRESRAPAVTTAIASRSATVEDEALAASFKRLGLSDSAAKVAARGRGSRPAGGLAEAGRRLSLSAARAKTFATRGLREVIRNVAGLSAACFAWVPDESDPTTWKMQIARSDDGDVWSPDEDLVRAAVVQLPELAGYDKALDIPAADLPAVKATLRSAWIACGAPVDDMPLELSQEALRGPFKRLGVTTEAGMRAAVRGRAGRI